jgi:hypothetical protein
MNKSMHVRRAITFLLGCWFATVTVVAINAGISFDVAEIAAKTPPGELSRPLAMLTEFEARQFPRYIASEVNRAMFERFGLIELALVIAIALTLFLHGYSRAATILAGVLFIMVCASSFLLTPQMVAQGRVLDFRPAEMFQDERARFANLHRLYGAFTLLRIACGSGIAWIMLKRSRSAYKRRSPGEIYAVNHTDDGEIDG